MCEFFANVWYAAEGFIVRFTEDHPFIVWVLIILLCGFVLGAMDEANVR